MSASLPSRFPVDGGPLDRLDKRLSTPLFKLQIGLVGEMLLSVPGCFFGMPAFHVVAPSLVACARGGCAASNPLHIAAASFVGLLLLAAWFHAQAPARLARLKLLYMPPALLACPVVGMLLAHALATSDPPALAAAAFYLVLWNVTLMPILALKLLGRRRRPVACDVAHIGQDVVQAADGKALPNICTMLRHGDANAAFPSGDVAGAVAFGYAIARCAGDATALLPALGAGLLAVSCVALSATGRMYYQAHHLLDVSCGGIISLGTCALTDAALGAFAPAVNGGGKCVATTAWWHPVAALAALIVFAKATGTQSATPSGHKE